MTKSIRKDIKKFLEALTVIFFLLGILTGGVGIATFIIFHAEDQSMVTTWYLIPVWAQVLLTTGLASATLTLILWKVAEEI